MKYFQTYQINLQDGKATVCTSCTEKLSVRLQNSDKRFCVFFFTPKENRLIFITTCQLLKLPEAKLDSGNCCNGQLEHDSSLT